MVEIKLKQNGIGMIQEETESEMIELEILEEQERKDREEIEELVPDEISGGKGRDLGGGDILEKEVEMVPDEIISGGLDRDFDYKLSLGGVSLIGNLGGDIVSKIVVSLAGNLGVFIFRELLVWLD